MQTQKKAKENFNKTLSEMNFSTDTSVLLYTEFNSNILRAGLDTATNLKSENRCCFHHSENHLLPIIAHHDFLLHHLRTKDPTLDLTHHRSLLQDAQIQVTDNIALAKAAWSSHQTDRIYSMRHTPKTAWESIKVLAGGGCQAITRYQQ